jgi:hypothetical protein
MVATFSARVAFEYLFNFLAMCLIMSFVPALFRGTKQQCSSIFWVPHDQQNTRSNGTNKSAQKALEALEEETNTTPDFVFHGSCIRLGKKDLIGVSPVGPYYETNKLGSE